jgi:hypothetical protein
MHPSTSQHNYLRACLLMHSQTLRLNRQQTHLDGLAHSLQSNSAAPYCMHKNCSCSAFAHALPQAKCQQQEGHRRRTHSFLEVWRVLHVLHVYSHYVTHHHPDPQASAHSCRSGLLSKKFSVRFSVRLTKKYSVSFARERGRPGSPRRARTPPNEHANRAVARAPRFPRPPRAPAAAQERGRGAVLERQRSILGMCMSPTRHPRDEAGFSQALPG